MRYFEHYYVQTMFMMLGESLCMGAFLLLKHVIYRFHVCNCLQGND